MKEKWMGLESGKSSALSMGLRSGAAVAQLLPLQKPEKGAWGSHQFELNVPFIQRRHFFVILHSIINLRRIIFQL
jgi:hypothetical protein